MRCVRTVIVEEEATEEEKEAAAKISVWHDDTLDFPDCLASQQMLACNFLRHGCSDYEPELDKPPQGDTEILALRAQP